MLINLPRKVVTSALAKDLMRYYVAKDPTTNVPSMLICMGEMTGVDMQVKYYTLPEKAPKFLEFFSDFEEGHAMNVPKEVVASLYSDSKQLSNNDIVNCCKVVSEIHDFMDTHSFVTGKYSAPVKVIMNEDESTNRLTVDDPSGNNKPIGADFFNSSKDPVQA